MLIYNAVLTQKRVLFLGYNTAAWDIVSAVLSATALVAPPLSGLLSRCFPYTNLTALDFLTG
jgi:hypothetical protein